MNSKCFRFRVTTVSLLTQAVAAINESELCKGVFAYLLTNSEAFRAIIGSIQPIRIVLNKFKTSTFSAESLQPERSSFRVLEE
jgi:hypothetical protein